MTPFLLGIIVAVAAKPVLRAGYKGVHKIRAEVGKIAQEAEIQASPGGDGADSAAIQRAVDTAVARAMADARANKIK